MFIYYGRIFLKIRTKYGINFVRNVCMWGKDEYIAIHMKNIIINLLRVYFFNKMKILIKLI